MGPGSATRIVLICGLLLADVAQTQETQLYSCLPDSSACSETPGILLEESCGEQFYFHRGRLSWPALRAVGPITIAVKLKHHWSTYLPLYVEILTNVDSTNCITGFFNYPVLVTEGTPACGGTWYSVGPLDISSFTPLGTLYQVQVEFFDANPVGYTRSPGLACVRVSTATYISGATWGKVKTLYR